MSGSARIRRAPTLETVSPALAGLCSPGFRRPAGERRIEILLAIASLSVMWWLARQKRRVGTALGSRAMTADAFQTDACFWLSVFLLVGIGANALLGLWWADPLAALGMAVFIGREAIEAWRGGDDD